MSDNTIKVHSLVGSPIQQGASDSEQTVTGGGARLAAGPPGDPFFYHQPGEAGKRRLAENRRRFRALRDYLMTLPQTREMSLALTHLQTAAMFANAAIALSDPEAEVIG